MKKNYLITLLLSPLFLIAQTGNFGPVTPINATIPFQGFGEAIEHLGTGEYQIYYDNIDGVLDKPIFFIDGFDPGDSRTISSMYGALNYGNPIQNLADLLRGEGYDLVVLNFPTYTSVSDGTTVIDGGADFIQRNAFILIELINTINGMKVGGEQNVVIGPSMGGLISRYALRYMEQNSLDHETRLYLSFDSPHLGANVPIGIQYLFNYMVNGEPMITEAEPLVSGLLNSAAAKQMLIDHYLAHLQGGSDFLQDTNITLPFGAPNFRDAFQSELDGMGFPQNTRNVSIINGSGIGSTTGTPGLELINHTFETGIVNGFQTRAIISTHFKPLASQTIPVTDFKGQVNLGIWIDAFTYQAIAETPSYTDGIDSAPGGQFDLYSFDDGSNALITEFVANLSSQYFNFIPTLSGLAITDTSDWYENPNPVSSPFDNVYIPNDNEPHVTLTDGNVAFALSEIRQTLNLKDIVENTFKLAKNPVDKTLTLLSTKTFENSRLTIVDILGNTVFSTIGPINNKTEIPLQLNSGLYILNIDTLSNLNYKTKIIVK